MRVAATATAGSPSGPRWIWTSGPGAARTVSGEKGVGGEAGAGATARDMPEPSHGAEEVPTSSVAAQRGGLLGLLLVALLGLLRRRGGLGHVLQGGLEDLLHAAHEEELELVDDLLRHLLEV